MSRARTIAMTLLMFQTLLPSNAHAEGLDVHGKGDFFIKVTINDKRNGVKFDLCSVTHMNQCYGLGKLDADNHSQFYNLEHLRSQKSHQKLDLAIAIIADAVIATTAVSGGVTLGLLAGINSTGLAYLISDTVAGATGGLVGAAGTVLLANFFNPLNPVEQWREGRMLDEDVILDKEVNLDRSIIVYAKSLDIALNKLDPMI